MRDTGIVKQALDTSCGSAATATILRFFYGRDVSEVDILAEVIAANLAGVASDFERSIRSTLIRAAFDGTITLENLKQNLLAQVIRAIGDGTTPADIQERFAQAIQDQLEATASFSDLKQAVEKFGFRAVGLSLTFGQLKQISIPVIAHLRHQGQEHFSVVRGIGRDGLCWAIPPGETSVLRRADSERCGKSMGNQAAFWSFCQRMRLFVREPPMIFSKPRREIRYLFSTLSYCSAHDCMGLACRESFSEVQYPGRP